MKSGTHQNYEI